MAHPLPLCTLYTVKGKTGEILYGQLSAGVSLIVAAHKNPAEPNVDQYKLYLSAPIAAYDRQVSALKTPPAAKAPLSAAEKSLEQATPPEPEAIPRTREPGEDNE